MFEKLLVATDFSAVSDQLLACASGMRRLGTKEVLLVHALGIRHLQDMQPLLAPMVEPRLRSQQEALEQMGFSVSSVILPGLAAHEIVDAAGANGAAAIAMATRGATFTHEAFVGGTISRVVRETHVPVLALQNRHEDANWAERCRQTCSMIAAHVLYVTDLSNTAERTFWVPRTLRQAERVM
ncbi:MAG: universal stress protein [Kiritimatiellia bacterium]